MCISHVSDVKLLKIKMHRLFYDFTAILSGKGLFM